jgi:hypothetical protein
MKSVIMFCFLIGTILVITGIYEEKLKIAKSAKKIKYKFIPRTYYEEQMASDNVSLNFADTFNYESPWFDRTVGALTDIPDFRNLKDRVKIG